MTSVLVSGALLWLYLRLWWDLSPWQPCHQILNKRPNSSTVLLLMCQSCRFLYTHAKIWSRGSSRVTEYCITAEVSAHIGHYGNVTKLLLACVKTSECERLCLFFQEVLLKLQKTPAFDYACVFCVEPFCLCYHFLLQLWGCWSVFYMKSLLIIGSHVKVNNTTSKGIVPCPL